VDVSFDDSGSFSALSEHETRLLHLGGLLGLDDQDKQNQIRLEIAKCAFNFNHYERAKFFCLQLIDMSFEPAWELCYNMSRSLSSIGAEREFMLGKVLSICPIEQMDHVLKDWKDSTEAAANANEFVTLDDEDSSDSLTFSKVTSCVELEQLKELFQSVIPETSHMTFNQMKFLELVLRHSVNCLDLIRQFNDFNFKATRVQDTNVYLECPPESFPKLLEKFKSMLMERSLLL
jgi:hypothetical protein